MFGCFFRWLLLCSEEGWVGKSSLWNCSGEKIQRSNFIGKTEFNWLTRTTPAVAHCQNLTSYSSSACCHYQRVNWQIWATPVHLLTWFLRPSRIKEFLQTVSENQGTLAKCEKILVLIFHITCTTGCIGSIHLREYQLKIRILFLLYYVRSGASSHSSMVSFCLSFDD